MDITQIEFRFPPFKFNTKTKTEVGKKYFEPNSSGIKNVAIKTSDNTTKTYTLKTISLVSGSALRQSGTNIYLVTKNTDSNDNSIYLCFKLEYGKEGIEAFNSTTGIKKIDIGRAFHKAPSKTVSISDNKQIIIVDCPVYISKPPLVSKYFNIIETAPIQMNVQTLDKVTHVIATASCTQKTASGLTQRDSLIIHSIMSIFSFLMIVGACVGQDNAQPVILIINIVLFAFWFLLVVIVYALTKNPKKLNKKALGQTVLVTKYVVFIFASMLTIFNQNELVNFLSKPDLLKRIREFLFPSLSLNISSVFISILNNISSFFKGLFILITTITGIVLTILLYAS